MRGRPRSQAEVSAIMRSVRSTDTQPELAFRRKLWRMGFRYRVAPSHLPGKPDIANASRRLAVFIDGDYWHGNQWRRRKKTRLEDQFADTPSREYWINKIRRNMQRDARNTNALIQDGWTVLRFWESDLKQHEDRYVKMTLELADRRRTPSHLSVLASKSVAEFFAGIGLMRLGLECNGWTVKFANDIDPAKYEMYRGQFNDAGHHFEVGDVHVLHEDCVPSVALATASFPCNDLSLAGSRSGIHGVHSSAFWGFVSLLHRLENRRPPLVLLENVTGFLTSHGGSDFKSALLALNELGYSVDAFIIDAARFVPQSRQRLFVVGQLRDEYSSFQPQADNRRFYESDVRPAPLADFILDHPEIQWNVRDLPRLPERTTRLEEILEDLPDDAPEWWSDERTEYLVGQMSDRHREIADQMAAGEGWSYGTVFRRVRHGRSMAELRTDGTAGCLRTPRGGSGRQILFRAGGGKFTARLLTGRECARLMGADDFVLTGKLNQDLFGFGDAVCVPVIRWIATYYLDPLVQELLHGRPLSSTYARNGNGHS